VAIPRYFPSILLVKYLFNKSPRRNISKFFEETYTHDAAVGSEACRLSSFKRMTMTGHRQRNSRKKTWPTQPGRSQAINWHSGTGKKDERRKDGQKPRADCDLS